MAKLATEGKFRGVPTDSKVLEKDGGVQWLTTLKVIEWFNPETKTFEDISAEGYTTDCYMTVISKKGDPNEVTVKQLRAAIGWDGVDLAKLNGTFDACQFGFAEDNYKDKPTLKVKWLDAYDAQPRTIQAADVKALNAKFAGKLRALAAKK